MPPHFNAAPGWQPYPHVPPHYAPTAQPAVMQHPYINAPPGAPFGPQQPGPSVPPPNVVGLPKRSTMLLIGGGMGALALIGIVVGAIALSSGHKSATVPTAPDSASASTLPPPPSEPPPKAAQADPPAPTAVAVAAEVEKASADENPVDAAALPASPTAVASADLGAPIASAVKKEDAPRAPTPPVSPVVAPPVRPNSAPNPAAVIPAKEPAPPADPNAFSAATARSKLDDANGVLAFCKKEGGVTGPGSAAVTFGPEGSVVSVVLDPPYAGTPAGDCVTGHFRRTKVSAFHGSPQTIKHAFNVPK